MKVIIKLRKLMSDAFDVSKPYLIISAVCLLAIVLIFYVISKYLNYIIASNGMSLAMIASVLTAIGFAVKTFFNWRIFLTNKKTAIKISDQKAFVVDNGGFLNSTAISVSIFLFRICIKGPYSEGSVIIAVSIIAAITSLAILFVTNVAIVVIIIILKKYHIIK